MNIRSLLIVSAFLSVLSGSYLIAGTAAEREGCCAGVKEESSTSAKPGLSGAPIVAKITKYRTDPEQTPGWTEDDLEFFMNGTMSTEVIPEHVLSAFMKIYPDLYPKEGLSAFGIITDGPLDLPTLKYGGKAEGLLGWTKLPIGFSRRNVPHLAGLSSLGVNCASCHVGEVIGPDGGPARRVLGMTSHFDPMSFFGALIVATFRTADPEQMQKFLLAYRLASNPKEPFAADRHLRNLIREQSQNIMRAVKKDPFGTEGIAAGGLHDIALADLTLSRAALKRGVDLGKTATAFLKLFHNMRAALHIPDAIPTSAPPPPGPSRNDAFALLSAVLFGELIPPANVKFGIVWNVKDREWVHWDGNNDNPLLRNMAAALGLGGPMIGDEGRIDMAAIRRQTDLSESIRAPKYPWAIDRESAGRGRMHYQEKCASCHDAAESRRLHEPKEIGTDVNRSLQIDEKQAKLYDALYRRLRIPGYRYNGAPFRATGKYWASDLAGVWARSPYLHNGSVRTMRELLSSSGRRATVFKRGSRNFEAAGMGYADGGAYTFNARNATDSNAGHEYGSELSAVERDDLMEYLRTK